MADLAENLRTFLRSNSGVAAYVGSGTSARIHQGAVPQGSALPYIWFRRSAKDTDRCLDAGVGDQPDEQRFDVESISDDMEQVQDLAEAIEDALNNYRGTFGSQAVQGVFVETQDDDYVPRGLMGDEGFHAAALAVQIFQ